MKIVAISGSLRAGSSNAALLRAAAAVAPELDFVFYGGLGDLPHFNPDLDVDAPPPVVQELRDLLRSAGAVLISSPEYAHGVPGSLKNALDWLVADGLLVDKPVALLNAAPAGGQLAQGQLAETLRTMNWRVVPGASLLEPFLMRKAREGERLDERAALLLRQALDALVRAMSAPPLQG